MLHHWDAISKLQAAKLYRTNDCFFNKTKFKGKEVNEEKNEIPKYIKRGGHLKTKRDLKDINLEVFFLLFNFLHFPVIFFFMNMY